MSTVDRIECVTRQLATSDLTSQSFFNFLETNPRPGTGQKELPKREHALLSGFLSNLSPITPGLFFPPNQESFS